MKVAPITLGTMVFAGLASAQTSDKDKAVAVGPWQIESSFTDQRKFDRCSMSRATQDGIEARFTRDEGGLSLTMSSARWQLEKGKNYPVEFAAGKAMWKTDVAATEDAVRIVLSDAKFNDALKAANNLEVRGAGSTFRIRSIRVPPPWPGSKRALRRTARLWKRTRSLRQLHSHRSDFGAIKRDQLACFWFPRVARAVPDCFDGKRSQRSPEKMMICAGPAICGSDGLPLETRFAGN